MPLEVREVDGVAVVALEGDIDLQSSPAVRQQLLACFDNHTRVVVDLSGRPGLEFAVKFARARIGEFDVDLVHEFFQGFVNHALVTLHVENLRGSNAHHQAETAFKAFGRALRMAVELDPRVAGVPSTKGSL